MTIKPTFKDPNKLTMKQVGLMKVVCAGNGPGAWCDLDQILERLPWRTTKESLQFSVRILIERGLMFRAERETRRRQGRRVIQPTELGLRMFGTSMAPASSSEPAVVMAPEKEAPEVGSLDEFAILEPGFIDLKEIS